MFRSSRGMRREFLILNVLLVLGCSDDATGPFERSPAGMYELTTIEGEPLPYFSTRDRLTGDSIWVVNKYLTLREDSTFSEVTTTAFRSVTNHRPTTTLMGTWSLSGTTLTLLVPFDEPVDPPIPNPFFRREAVWDGDRRLTVQSFDLTMEFLRQSAF